MAAARYTMAPEPGAEFILELDEALPNEKRMAEWARSGQVYEPDVSRLCCAVLRAGDAAIDVGANLGYFSLLCARLVGAAGQVLAFEPDPANLARLGHQLRINGAGNVRIVGQPASERAGEADFFLNSDDSGGNALWNPALFPGTPRSKANERRLRLRTTTLDAEVGRHALAAPKLIKVDTEGAEQKVLQGARGLLEGCGVPFVVCELHPFGLAQMGDSQDSLRELMDSFGYSTFALSWRPVLPKLIPPGTHIESPYIVNLLFTTPELLGSYWPVEQIDPRIL